MTAQRRQAVAFSTLLSFLCVTFLSTMTARADFAHDGNYNASMYGLLIVVEALLFTMCLQPTLTWCAAAGLVAGLLLSVVASDVPVTIMQCVAACLAMSLIAWAVTCRGPFKIRARWMSVAVSVGTSAFLGLFLNRHTTTVVQRTIEHGRVSLAMSELVVVMVVLYLWTSAVISLMPVAVPLIDEFPRTLCILYLCFGLWLYPSIARNVRVQSGSCLRNLRHVEVAVNYFRGREGRLPSTLAEVVPTYLSHVPTCPSAGVDTYSAGYESAEHACTVSCKGDNHVESLPPLGWDFPQCSSHWGLLLEPPRN